MLWLKATVYPTGLEEGNALMSREVDDLTAKLERTVGESGALREQLGSLQESSTNSMEHLEAQLQQKQHDVAQARLKLSQMGDEHAQQVAKIRQQAAGSKEQVNSAKHALFACMLPCSCAC